MDADTAVIQLKESKVEPSSIIEELKNKVRLHDIVIQRLIECNNELAVHLSVLRGIVKDLEKKDET